MTPSYAKQKNMPQKTRQSLRSQKLLHIDTHEIYAIEDIQETYQTVLNEIIKNKDNDKIFDTIKNKNEMTRTVSYCLKRFKSTNDYFDNIIMIYKAKNDEKYRKQRQYYDDLLKKSSGVLYGFYKYLYHNDLQTHDLIMSKSMIDQLFNIIEQINDHYHPQSRAKMTP